MKSSFAVLSKFVFCSALLISAASAAEKAQPLAADILSKDGKKIGEVTASSIKEGVEFQVKVSGLSPGNHGIHIHSVGKCDAPDFKSAGGHFAGAGQHHGLKNPQGPHFGDLPNLIVDKDGQGHARFIDKRITLAGGENSLKKTGGTSLVIHAGEDDEKSDPAGNSGDRVACAVLSQ